MNSPNIRFAGPPNGNGSDLPTATFSHVLELERLAGDPPALDLVQPGLGSDGHTASLIPGVPVHDTTGDFATTGLYGGTLRVTMTAPLPNRARRRLLLITGDGKDDALIRLTERDPSIPGSLISGIATTLVTDRQIPN